MCPYKTATPRRVPMHNNRVKKLSASVSTLIVTTALVLSTGCAVLQVQDPLKTTADVRIAATPDAAPQRAITNFSQSLQCMDGLLKRYEISGLLVGTEEVADAGSEIAGTKDMLMTALSTMGRKSKAISVVALAQDLSDVSRYHSLHESKGFAAPDFFIRLSAPQIDKGVDINQVGGGLRVDNAVGLESSRDRISSIVSLDLNAGLVKNLQLLPGVYSSNSIAVVRQGSATDVSGEIRKLGAVFFVSDDNSEGFHHSARTLIELGAIEIIGKLTQTPYWECLDIAATNSKVQKQIMDWYSSLSWLELAKFIQTKLHAMDLYSGATDGIDSPEFSSAVARYKSQQGMVADSELSYELYYALVLDPAPGTALHLNSVAGNVKAASSRADSPDSGAATFLRDQENTLDPLELTLDTRFGSDPIVFKSGESIEFSVTASVDSHLYCYYQQSDGKVMKIFPNRFSQTNTISANRTIYFPDDNRYQIRADKRGSTEKIMCMVSYENIEEKLPFTLAEKDFQPLPVKSIENVYAFYKSIGGTVPLRKTLNIEIQ